jgi:hypothetical protein
MNIDKHVTRTFFRRLPKTAKKATISFVLITSICPHGTSQLPLDGFLWNLIFENFWRSVDKIQVLLKSAKNNGYFTGRPIYIFDHISLSYS